MEQHFFSSDPVTATADDQQFLALATELFCTVEVRDGSVRTLRGAWTSVVGYSEAKLLASPIFSFVHPEDVEQARLTFETIAEVRETGWFSFRFRAKDGTYRTLEWTARAGNVAGEVVAAARDVTELEAMKLQAQVHEELIGQVARGAPIVISLFDREGIIQVQLGAGLEKLGLKQNQLKGMSVFEAFAEAGDALVLIRAALEGKESTNTQILGQTTVWDNWFSPIRNAQGTITGAISISTDVTERDRSQQALEDRLRVIEEQSRAIRVMSAPIIEVWQGILVVPVVGQLDAQNAADMMERLLSTVVSRGATFAILDLTAVDQLESTTAEHLLRMIQALGLLGTRGLLSGIRPSVARALIELGIDLGKVVSVSSLHAALRMCMVGKRGRLTS